MFIKKDSLLLRIISYNGIAIVIVASIMATLFGIMIFNELNMRLLDKSILIKVVSIYMMLQLMQ